MFPEADEGRLSLTMNDLYANPDIGGASLGGEYLVVSRVQGGAKEMGLSLVREVPSGPIGWASAVLS